MKSNFLASIAESAHKALLEKDQTLHSLLIAELHRQSTTLTLVASCSVSELSVLACEGSFLDNVTAEGYPGARYHAGCKVIDDIERLAISRACRTYGARYANVQPLSASIANQAVIASLLYPGETLLGMSLDAGGHLSHGSRVNISGCHFNAISYGLDNNGMIDFNAVEQLALQHKPKLIIAGTTAYPRTINFARFRSIADKVGAFMLADITHIAGLVAAGEHPSPIDIAHVTTLCTHKQLYGPRGGIILSGKDHRIIVDKANGITLEQQLDRGIFPLYQGAPAPNKMAAKARALDAAGSSEFKENAHRIRTLAACAAEELKRHGVKVQSGGTDNHIVIIDVLSTFGLTGIVAQEALEECGIIVNKNRIIGDGKPITIASGVRLGSNSAATRKITNNGMREICAAIVLVLEAATPHNDKEYTLNPTVRDEVKKKVRDICTQFPIPGFDAVEPSFTTPAL